MASGAVYLGVRNGILNLGVQAPDLRGSLPGREERDSQRVRLGHRRCVQSTWA